MSRVKAYIAAAVVLVSAQVVPSAAAYGATVKNVIVMIPDGTSVPVLSLARWYNWYLSGGGERLEVDPYLCGLVKTHSSNAPIGDSAPTTSAFMTGYFSVTKYVSTYPPATKDDIYPVDPSRHLQPLTTVGEAARIVQGKSLGVVATSEFTHATPADVTAHYYQRDNYKVISKQMVHNGVDLVIAGGTSILSSADREYLENGGTSVIKDDITAFRNYKGKRLWALFSPKAQPYDIDRDTTAVPSLAEMASKAVEVLSKNPKGFFLMVEGSKVDWAAHANDPVGMITEFLAFDRAVGKMIEFARKEGETLVIVLPDHGNSGISIGNRNTNSGYDKRTIAQLIEPLRGYKLTAQGVADLMNTADTASVRGIFKRCLGIELTPLQLEQLKNSPDYAHNPADKSRHSKVRLQYRIAEIMSAGTDIGFTTNGHTGEDVFLAAYHPDGDTPRGLMDSRDINRYLCRQLGMEGVLDSLNNANFVPHDEVFRGMAYEVRGTGTDTELIVKNGNKTMEVTANTNLARMNGRGVEVSSLAVYVEENRKFYLPRYLADVMK